jgi:hypothetical protein
MPEDGEKFVNTHWHIGIAGREEELLAYAAYPDYHHGATSAGGRTIGRGDDPVNVSLWTADGRIVFQAPVAAIAYMRRADATRKVDRNAPPGQVRDMQAELEESGPLAPIKPVPVDPLLLGEVRPEPRRWQYPVGGAV